MTLYDPPSEPPGHDHPCPFCDHELTRDPWTKEYYCDNPDCPSKEE